MRHYSTYILLDCKLKEILTSCEVALIMLKMHHACCPARLAWGLGKHAGGIYKNMLPPCILCARVEKISPVDKKKQRMRNAYSAFVTQ